MVANQHCRIVAFDINLDLCLQLKTYLDGTWYYHYQYTRKPMTSQDKTPKACEDVYLVLANSTSHLNSRNQEYPFEDQQDFCGLSNFGSKYGAYIQWQNILQ